MKATGCLSTLVEEVLSKGVVLHNLHTAAILLRDRAARERHGDDAALAKARQRVKGPVALDEGQDAPEHLTSRVSSSRRARGR